MPENNLVCFNCLIVNAITSNSGVFVGTNTQSDWRTDSNNKYGFGTIAGTRNVVSRAVNVFNDNDLIDTPIITQNYINKLPEDKSKADSTKKPGDSDNILIYGGRKKPESC